MMTLLVQDRRNRIDRIAASAQILVQRHYPLPSAKMESFCTLSTVLQEGLTGHNAAIGLVGEETIDSKSSTGGAIAPESQNQITLPQCKCLGLPDHADSGPP